VAIADELSAHGHEVAWCGPRRARGLAVDARVIENRCGPGEWLVTV
jgi:hypothetical protein